MRRNIGTIDRLIRALAGTAILVFGLAMRSSWGLLGLIPIVVAIVGYCPPYALLGIDTAPKTTPESEPETAELPVATPTADRRRE